MLLVTPKSTTQLVALTGQPLGSVGRPSADPARGRSACTRRAGGRCSTAGRRPGICWWRRRAEGAPRPGRPPSVRLVRPDQVRQRFTSSAIRSSSASIESNFSMPRTKARKSTATCRPYRSRPTRSMAYASTVRSRAVELRVRADGDRRGHRLAGRRAASPRRRRPRGSRCAAASRRWPWGSRVRGRAGRRAPRRPRPGAGGPGSRRRPSMSPSATSRRVSVEENGSPPPASPLTQQVDDLDARSRTSCPARRGSRRSPRPCGRSGSWGPRRPRLACSLSTRTFTTKSAGDSLENSLVKGRISSASTPSSAISSARRWCGASSGGWLPGRTTSLGCGSKVTTTDGNAQLTGALHGTPDDQLVAAVDPVVGADGDDAASPVLGDVLQATPALHCDRSSPTRVRSTVSLRRSKAAMPGARARIGMEAVTRHGPAPPTGGPAGDRPKTAGAGRAPGTGRACGQPGSREAQVRRGGPTTAAELDQERGRASAPSGGAARQQRRARWHQVAGPGCGGRRPVPWTRAAAQQGARRGGGRTAGRRVRARGVVQQLASQRPRPWLPGSGQHAGEGRPHAARGSRRSRPGDQREEGGARGGPVSRRRSTERPDARRSGRVPPRWSWTSAAVAAGEGGGRVTAGQLRVRSPSARAVRPRRRRPGLGRRRAPVRGGCQGGGRAPGGSWRRPPRSVQGLRADGGRGSRGRGRAGPSAAPCSVRSPGRASTPGPRSAAARGRRRCGRAARRAGRTAPPPPAGAGAVSCAQRSTARHSADGSSSASAASSSSAPG